ncbi:WecB/TagA/CpsF family glycosyltransferase [Bacillus sp. KH172YL63]|uniref:WecB/TagA/CpsF family glycosyltransferase n=1 Tax=Bacillus sp. KH172YL63 TaxID=2709784 RepID=UPI0013E49B7C|nr:WecB/TagA/CpsF family glycosyltransferase [Bacillus sp. KH172YL63]BCB05869.1 hypothetical protein KH172YL63_40020 [Bacillus sp. KH172YL63]
MDFNGIKLFLDTSDQLIKRIISSVSEHKKSYFYALNPDCYLKFLDDYKYKEILQNEKNIVYVDGMGIIYTQKFLKLPVAKERIATTDLFPQLLKELNQKKLGYRIFLLGGKGETGKRVIERFKKEYPNVNFVGYHHGYFEEKDVADIISIVNNLEVDILFVGFGCPVQEKWVDDHSKELYNVKAFITCGGLFDYYSGNVKRAPLFMRKYGLEWLFRLIQEPKRLYKRYLFGNARYVTHMIGKKLGG